jgi:hypothetical protein
MKDDIPDYQSYTSKELLKAQWEIDREKYPAHYAALRHKARQREIRGLTDGERIFIPDEMCGSALKVEPIYRTLACRKLLLRSSER